MTEKLNHTLVEAMAQIDKKEIKKMRETILIKEESVVTHIVTKITLKRYKGNLTKLTQVDTSGT